MRKLVILGATVLSMALLPTSAHAAVVQGGFGATAPYPTISAEAGWDDQIAQFVPNCWGPNSFTCVISHGGEWDSFSQWIKYGTCAAGIAWFIAGNVFAIGKVKKLGGAFKLAKVIIRAKNRAASVYYFFGYVTGVGGVVSACT